MVGDAALQQPAKMFADEKFLFGSELKGIGRRQLSRQVGRHGFGCLPARSEDQNGAKIFGQSFGDQARPVTADFTWKMVVEIVRVDFLKGNGALIVPNEDC